MQEPLVSICCLAYNHEPYIRECLDGFLMQKTDFSFEVLIHDDASTDKTADIIREYEAKYPEIIKPIYQTENQYSRGIGVTRVYQLPRAKGKYIAMCEGDDYWTDPLKLQKQVDFLERNEEFVICAHRYKIYNENNNTWEEDYVKDYFNKDTEGIVFDNAMNLKSWFTKTMTLLFRKDAIDFSILDKYRYKRDVQLNYHILKSGKGYCMNLIAAVYRKHDGGVFSNKTHFTRSKIGYHIYKEMVEYNPEDKELKAIYDSLAMQYFGAIRQAIYNRDFSYGLFKNVMEFAINEFKEKGFKAFVFCIRKSMLSFYKSFSKKM